jgi:hypothetical protein
MNGLDAVERPRATRDAGPFAVRFFPKQWRARAFLSLLLVCAAAAKAADGDTPAEPLHTVRSENRIVLQASTSNLTLTETIVVSPVAVKKENEQPGAVNLVHLLLSPLWIKEGESQRPAFTVVRPYINVTHGRIRRLALVRPDGEPVISPDLMTPDCRYVLTLEFSHALPKRFTVTVTMAQPTGIEAENELLYTASNDGQPFGSGPPESFYTVLRVIAEATLGPWKVMEGDKVLPRADSTSVRLNRNVSHTIRFGSE